jgi:acylphosphatase
VHRGRTGGGAPLKRLQALVTGRVQGVGFREFVRQEAVSRGITGWVRNSDDGRNVEFVAEGEQAALDALLESVRIGPRFAKVENVECEYSDASCGFSRFSVEM